VPSTVIGLVLFAALVVPGYVWIRAVEKLRPRPGRSGLTEVADLVFVGLLRAASPWRW
jgi:hypothetical protein